MVLADVLSFCQLTKLFALCVSCHFYHCFVQLDGQLFHDLAWSWKLKLVFLLTAIPEHLFNLKFAAKDLERNAKKCEKQEKEEKVKLKKVHFTRCLSYFNYLCNHLWHCMQCWRWLWSVVPVSKLRITLLCLFLMLKGKKFMKMLWLNISVGIMCALPCHHCKTAIYKK